MMDARDNPASARCWVAEALRTGTASSSLDGLDAEVLIAVADEQGVLPLLEWRLRHGSGWVALPEAFRTSLIEGARGAAVQALLRKKELQRIATVLVRGNLRALLLKGPAFGCWLYPEPYLRVSGDIDLLFESRAESDRAMRELTSLGYELAFEPTGMTYEMTARAVEGALDRPELDLHCRLVNVPAYAEALGFDELWNASVGGPGFDGLRMLDPIRSLAHACIHRAVDLSLQRPDHLKWLYDIHLMMSRMDPGAWGDFVELVKSKGLGGVCLRSMQDAMTIFASTPLAGVMDEIHRLADVEPLDWRRLHDWRYMQLRNFRSLPGIAAKARWAWERTFPTSSHLRELHQDGTWHQLMWRRFLRGVSRLRGKG